MDNNLGNELIILEKVSRALGEARTLSEIKDIRDKAEAVRKYAQSAALGLTAQNHAAEVKLRAERKAGNLLSKLGLRGGDRKSNNHYDCLKLQDLDISQNQSTRWQLEATLPDQEFEEYLRSTRESGREISTAAVLRLARMAAMNGVTNGTAITNGIAENGKSPLSMNGHVYSSVNGGGKLVRIDEALTELSNHRDLLDRLLEPLYTGRDDLLPAQRRVLGHLLREMAILLHQLQRITHSFANSGQGAAT